MREILYIWAIVQSFYFGTSLLIQKKGTANKILAFLFILIFINILSQYILKFVGWWNTFPELVFVSDSIRFAIGPIIYLYIREFIKKDFKSVFFLHFLPAILFTVYFFSVEIIYKKPFEFFQYIGTRTHQTVLLLIVLSNLIYLILYFITLKKSRKEFHRDKNLAARWLTFFLIFFVFEMLISLFQLSYHISKSRLDSIIAENIRLAVDFVFITLNTLILMITGFLAMQNPEMLKENLITKLFMKKQLSINRKEAENILENLKKLETEKFYLDSELKEKSLAEKLGIPSYLLSKILNEHLGKSFSEYINEKRIEAAKEVLSKPENSKLTMYAVALECGFSSESVFYINFKKHSGMTPNQFKKKVLN